MCGIVLAGCSVSLDQAEISLFEKLVYHDTIRGSHSTGVFAGYRIKDNKAEQYVIHGKTAQAGPDFLDSKVWKSIKSQAYTPSKKVKATALPYFLVGHNRYATMGAKTSENAHPFVSGDITLVHNGTLNNQSLLPDHKKFEVDSANICHAINKQGIEETLKQLDGAFTLIWYDDHLKTLNIIRNEERPFHLARTELDTWFGASEEEMLMWLLKRESKYSLYKSSPKILEHFECEVGVQYIFDVEDGNFELVEKVKHELPKFEYISYSNYGNYFDDYSWNRSPYTAQKRGANNFLGKGVSGNVPAEKNTFLHAVETVKKELFEEAGIPFAKIGDDLWFLSTSFERYPTNTGKGKVDGILAANPDVKVCCHSLLTTEYEKDVYYRGEIISIYKVEGAINILVKNATHTPAETEEYIVTEDGFVYNSREWSSKGKNICLRCITAIPFEEAEDAKAYGNGYVCISCEDEKRMADVDAPFMMEEDAYEQNPFQGDSFYCTHCGLVCETSTEMSLSAGTCTTCYYSFLEQEEETDKVIQITKELDNGEIVTQEQWSKMNTCSCCKSKITFRDAECCVIENGKITCINCYL